MGRPRHVAVFNTSQDLADTFREVLEDAGFTVSIGWLRELRRDEQSYEAFVRAHDPEVLVFDVALPYEANWKLVQDLVARPATKGRGVVFTTTNARALAELVGANPAHEIMGKPVDLAEFLKAVERALPPAGKA